MAAVPSTTWQMLAGYAARRQELPKGLDVAWDFAAGYAGRLVPRRRCFLAQAGRVLAFERQFADLSDARLREAAGRRPRRNRQGQ